MFCKYVCCKYSSNYIRDTACPNIYASPAGMTLSRSSANDFFLELLSREKSGGGSEERCDEGKVIYHVFKLCLMKMKYYNLYNKLNCLSAIILIYSDNTYIG